MEILIHPNPILREKSRELNREEILDDNFQDFMNDLGQTMFAKDGIGLAAPQVDRSIRAIVVNMDNKAVSFINPEIIKKSLLKTTMEEGCLSLPGIYGLVRRPRGVEIKYLDLQGKEKEIKAKGLLARVLQHEIDHLKGILFIDKIKNKYISPS